MLLIILSSISDPEQRNKFTELYYEYEEKLSSIAMAITKHKYYADKALSDTWKKIAENIDTIYQLPRSQTEAYLKKAVRNNSINCLKEKSTDTKLLEYNDRYFYKIEKYELEDYQTENEAQNVLLNILSSLPYIYRSVLYYQHVLKYSRKDIAYCLNISEETVKTRLRRARLLVTKLAQKEKRNVTK